MSEYASDEIDQLRSDSEGNERWRTSEPPPDPWGDVDGADEDGNWRFQIVGEEIDYEGNIKHEVRWDDWYRADGTKTTWEFTDHGGIDSSQWTKKQRRRRRSLAAETLKIELPTTTDIHNDATYLRSQAYEEKLQRAQKEPQPNQVVEMARLLAKHQAHIHPQGQGTGLGASTSGSPLRSSQRTTTRQHTLNSITSSSTPARGSSKASVQSVKPSSSTASSSQSQLTQAKALPTSTTSMSNSRVVQPTAVSSSSSARPSGKAHPTIPGPIHATSTIVVSGSSKKPAPVTTTPTTSKLPRVTSIPVSQVPSNKKTSGISTPLPSSNLQLKHHTKTEPSSLSTPIDKGKRRALDTDSDAPPPMEIASLPRKRVKRTIASSDPPKTPETIRTQSWNSSSASTRPTNHSSTLSAKKMMPASTAVHRTPPPEETPEGLRRNLGNEWTLTARARGGASISFFNDVDNEAVPSLSPTFRYLECAYLFAKGIDRPDSGFLTACDCDVCGPKPDTCGCQADWEQQDFAYTSSGFYAFNVPKNIEVIECNKLCACKVETCMNRVSQRPRDVPIQIFKTRTRGWGVRAKVPLKRGKVIGIYTGRLIRRETSRALPTDLASYCFDLDGDEMVSNDASQSTQSMQGKYSVDSRREGNWTRFVNHSCSPNLEIYLVVHDKPAGSGMPYIAFVANQAIPAYTELAFDYHPEVAAQIALERIKSKGKPIKLPIPQDARECLCEAADCRGYLA